MTIIESFKELKKAWGEFIDALCEAWHIDKLVNMINWVCKRSNK